MNKFLLFGLMALLLLTAARTLPPVVKLPPDKSRPLPTATPRPDTVDPLPASLAAFAKQLENGTADIRGIYVQNKLAYFVVQQPRNNLNYISTAARTVTQSRAAKVFDGVLFLAHNSLAGKVFPGLSPGDVLSVIYGNGRIDSYGIVKQERYQAIRPSDPFTDYVDLQSGLVVTWSYVFERFYMVENGVVLQTCIRQDGRSDWGRLFVVTEAVK
jgi:hypothetical protein